MYRLPRMITSKDYDELIEQALERHDKEWFHELVQRKKELQQAEKEARKELGLSDQP